MLDSRYLMLGNCIDFILMQVFNLGFGAYIVSCLLMVVSKADSAVLEFRSKVSEVQGYMKTKASATSCVSVCRASGRPVDQWSPY